MHFHAEQIAPFVSWLRNYKRGFIRPDLFAGVTVAVVAVPQAMACAIIAGLPVQFGLYTSIIPTIVGCLWGSSAQLITGPTTAISLVVFSVLSPLAATGSTIYIELAFVLALLVGLVQIAMGLARLGALLNFVSHSVLIGFTSGAAVLIAFKQVPGLFGLQVEKTSVFYKHLYNILTHLHQTDWITFGLGVGTIAIIVAIRKFRPAWPGVLIAMVLTGALVALLDLDQRGVAVIGEIPRRLPPLHFPDMAALRQIDTLAPGALAIALLGLGEAVSIAKSIADQTRQRLNINREFLGQGLANVAASVFSGYPGSGSFVRSAVNFKSGGTTPLSGIISGVTVALALLLLAPQAALLPMSALAGVLITVAYDMVRKKDLVRTIRTTRGDAAVLVVTFASTLLLNIEFAIYVGVLLSIGLYLAATSHPRIHSMVPDLESGKLVGSVRGQACLQMDVVYIEGALFFGAADYILDDLHRRLRNHPYQANMLIRMHKVSMVDASGVHSLEIVLEEIVRRGGGLYFSGLNHRVFEVLKNAGFIQTVGRVHIRSSTGAAIRQAMRESFCPAVCAVCDLVVFRECEALKRGDWEIFGPGVQPRVCRLPQEPENDETGKEAP